MKEKKRRTLIIILSILLLLTMVCFGCIFYLKQQKERDDLVEDNPSSSIPSNKEEEDNKDPLEVALRNEKYFLEKNLSRYLSYAKNNPDKNMSDVITDVNAKIDYAFYTEVLDTNINDGILMLVNKYYKLSEDYEPLLVDMEPAYTYGTFKMQKEAYEHFKDMCDKASNDGIHLYNVSAYRSYERQKGLYNSYVNSGGREYADATSARPGHSEHQTGLVSDIITADEDKHFENTKEYAWLKNNAYKYGFIERFPKDKEYITGYIFEPWHYRYVGVEAATYIHDNEITFEEYYAYFVER